MTSGPDPVGSVVEALSVSLPAGRVIRDAPLGALTTYRVGGSAGARVDPADEAELRILAQITAGTAVNVVVVGRGSNLLVADGGFDGLAVVLGHGFTTVRTDGTRVVAGGAAKLPVVARATVQAGLSGFEWAVGVPGSVGGAVRMNAGGHGTEMVDVVASADVVDLRTGACRRRLAATLDFGYRRSDLGPADVVAAAELSLARGDRNAGAALLAEIVRWRRNNQPGGQNAGSVFTNPSGNSAGSLIDTAGLKGLRIGSAEVSTKHANFIQADPAGRASDVKAVMDEVQRRVLDVHGILLAPETRLVGFDAGGSPW